MTMIRWMWVALAVAAVVSFALAEKATAFVFVGAGLLVAFLALLAVEAASIGRRDPAGR